MTETKSIKICKKCNKEKDFDAFFVRPRMADNLSAWCKQCHRDYEIECRKQKSESKIIFTSRLIKRFFKQVNKTDYCWNWTSALNPYGSFSIFHSKYLAHRISYLMHKGSIPDGLKVCHTCDNPKCVNPEHLWIGTQKENMQDCFAKGRMKNRYQRKGVEINFAKLTEEQVIEIRHLHRQGVPRKELGVRFNTCTGNIDSIVTYKNWKHLP